MPNLKSVVITEDMTYLIRSLEGKEYHFELEVQY